MLPELVPVVPSLVGGGTGVSGGTPVVPVVGGGTAAKQMVSSKAAAVTKENSDASESTIAGKAKKGAALMVYCSTSHTIPALVV